MFGFCGPHVCAWLQEELGVLGERCKHEGIQLLFQLDVHVPRGLSAMFDVMVVFRWRKMRGPRAVWPPPCVTAAKTYCWVPLPASRAQLLGVFHTTL